MTIDELMNNFLVQLSEVDPQKYNTCIDYIRSTPCN